ncbi:recombination mediator RecR, partial [Treponema pallidum]
GIICVVERAQDVEMMAGVGEYRGLFHVLGGVIAPLEGVGPDQLRIAALLKRLQESSVREVILALNPTVEGDTTALYVQKILANFPVIVTRLASGIPVGGDLEYIDRTTLAHSLRGRRPLDCSEA